MNSAPLPLKARWRLAVCEWMIERRQIWIQQECQVNIPPALCHDYYSVSNCGAKKGYMKALSFLLLLSSAEAPYTSPRLPSLIFFLFLFLPSCPHSIHFHSPPQFTLQLLSFQPYLSIFPNLYSAAFSLSSVSLPPLSVNSPCFLTNLHSDRYHHMNVPFYWHILIIFSLTPLHLFCQCSLPFPSMLYCS